MLKHLVAGKKGLFKPVNTGSFLRGKSVGVFLGDGGKIAVL
jgi:hypothetical protein